MSDQVVSASLMGSADSSSASPGQMLRRAREATGLHIVALAAALKVPVRKLEALEGDRWDELTDATFTRALASSVARHLKVDAAPILEGLPAGKPKAIDIPDGLGRASDSPKLPVVNARLSPLYWVVLVLLVAAGALYLAPASWMTWKTQSVSDTSVVTAEKPVASDAGGGATKQDSTGAQMGAVQVAQADGQPSTAPGPAPVVASGPVSAPAPSVPVTEQSSQSDVIKIEIKVIANSWLEISGKDGKVRYQRVAKAGESVEFDDAAGYAVVVGNVSGTQVLVRGQPFDMTEFNKNNVARFEVK